MISKSARTPKTSNQKRKLGFWTQVAITFFIVSGGPYGLETAVAEIGPAWTTALVILIPLLWALPTGLMVAELSSMISEQGGYYVWVRTALGEFWGFQEGWWTLCYSAVDLAIYPVLFITYLSYFYPEAASNMAFRFALCSVFVTAAVLMNLRGSLFVGMHKVFEVLLVSSPFVIFLIIGIQNHFWVSTAAAISAGVSQNLEPAGLAAGLAILIWNFTGWDNATTYADEVHDPGFTIPKTVFAAITLVVLSYLLSLLVGFSITTDPKVWGETSGWPEILSRAGGPWLGTLTALTAVISAWALFNSQLLYIARLPAAMAKDSLLPKALMKTSQKTAVPVYSLIACGVCALVFSNLSFGKLMVLDILLYSLGLALEFIALIRLRQTEPEHYRPFRIPLPTWGLVMMSMAPLALAVVVAVSSVSGENGSSLQIIICAIAIVVGLLLGAKFRKSQTLKFSK